MRKFMMIAILLLVAGCTGTPNLEVYDAKTTPSAMIDDAVSIFMLIDNTGKADDSLVSASIVEYPSATVEIHDVIDGKMQEIEGINIAAGEITELKSGSYHVMGFDVTDPSGELTVVLNFEKSGEITVKAPVMESSGMATDMGSDEMGMESESGMEEEKKELVVIGCG